MMDSKEFISKNELCVVACIESFSSRKGEKLLDLWLKMEGWFTEIKVPVLLLSRDGDRVCSQIEILYASKLFFKHEANDNFFKEYQVLKKKLIFGKEKTIVYPYIFLFQDGKIYTTAKRMSEKSIAEIYIMCLEIQYKKFLKKFKNMFDIR